MLMLAEQATIADQSQKMGTKHVRFPPGIFTWNDMLTHTCLHMKKQLTVRLLVNVWAALQGMRQTIRT